MTAIQLMLAGIFTFAIAACRNGKPPAPPPTQTHATSHRTSTAAATSALEADLNTFIAKRGSVTFRSYDGKWVGMDGDTDLTFLPNGAVHMFEYGLGVSGYHGTYAIDPQGKITLQLPTFGQTWPAMRLQKDATSLFLTPVQSGIGIVMGNRGGATSAGGHYWPFRPLNPVEEAQVRERIKK